MKKTEGRKSRETVPLRQTLPSPHFNYQACYASEIFVTKIRNFRESFHVNFRKKFSRKLLNKMP
jgi:hypothetical protein